ncbi:MAG TPA: bifunctional phosphoribosylaminoimidazolecarboxamide formyltransferase/IMP cyclohydrolase [Pirellulales bacterium]|jgi:phosphoribosylaminoimidazolecarboxamide formyltransferase/IMP cyclohydrolase|nr:bifunctional phosphoribosylaminoimidazolecarboxamide formyltransferase/IMP cyclohydrolase [Pirellulales bacterium]
MNIIPITHALISVSDKLGLAEFARGLAAHGVELFASGGSRKHLEQAGLEVREISAYTGFPEMMDGRIKTLHPKVHGGILCRHNREDDRAAMQQHGIVPFELVVVNLYPFEATIAKADVTDDEAIENIDIGGPTLIRGAAKNHAFTAVATSTEQYATILDQISQQGGTSLELRRKLAAEAFEMVARYDRAIADYFSGNHFGRATNSAPLPLGEGRGEGAETFPPTIHLNLQRREVLRYGENPHQQGALYALKSGTEGRAAGANLVSARQLNGKELSYNNLLDLDSALAIVRSLAEPAAVVIKHNNPCGAATAGTLATAMKQALDGDPVSAFGGVVGLNRPLDTATAEVLAAPDRFIEAIVAPEFEPAGLEILTTKPKWKANVRLLQVGSLDAPVDRRQFRAIDGGFLVHDADMGADPESEWKIVTKRHPTADQVVDMRFAWALVRHVKSNAIVLVSDEMIVGVGAGQMSRVDAVEIAVRKAGNRANGAVLASDAFFPFADGIELATAAGVRAVIQPGGSKRDEESISACDSATIPMIFTGRRHFKH